MSEAFGVNHFGENWGWSLLGSAITAFIFQEISSAIYQSHAPPHQITCYGAQCFQYTFIIMTGLCVIAVVLGVINVVRNKKPHQLL